MHSSRSEGGTSPPSSSSYGRSNHSQPNSEQGGESGQGRGRTPGQDEEEDVVTRRRAQPGGLLSVLTRALELSSLPSNAEGYEWDFDDREDNTCDAYTPPPPFLLRTAINGGTAVIWQYRTHHEADVAPNDTILRDDYENDNDNSTSLSVWAPSTAPLAASVSREQLLLTMDRALALPTVPLTPPSPQQIPPTPPAPPPRRRRRLRGATGRP